MGKFHDETGDLTCHFPPHKGELWEDVVREDRKFVEQIIGMFGPKIEEELEDYLVSLLEEAEEESQ